MAYSNQKEIGAVFKRLFGSGEVKVGSYPKVKLKVGPDLQRSDVFVTSKVWNTYHSYGRAKEAVDIILAELELDYIDLVLVHWPMGYEEGAELFPKVKFEFLEI